MGKEDDRHPRFGHPTGSCRLHVRVRDRDAPLARQARSTGRPARPRPSRLRLVLGGRLRAGLDSRDVGILFGDADEAGLLLSGEEGASRSFAAGVGTVGTYGKRTATVFDLNLAGRTGPAPRILAKTGAEKIAGALSGIAEAKLALDVGLTGAEVIGCLIPR